jgi:hypothetical protein
VPVERIAEVGTSDGLVLDVVRSGHTVVIAAGKTAMPVDDAVGMRDVLLRAADAEIGRDRVRLIGSVGRVHVLRFPYHVRVTDAPDPLVHTGWSMSTGQARELGQALLEAAGVSVREPQSA